MLKYHEYETAENPDEGPLPAVQPQVRPATSTGHRAQPTIKQQSVTPRSRPQSTNNPRSRAKANAEKPETRPSESDSWTGDIYTPEEIDNVYSATVSAYESYCW